MRTRLVLVVIPCLLLASSAPGQETEPPAPPGKVVTRFMTALKAMQDGRKGIEDTLAYEISKQTSKPFDKEAFPPQARVREFKVVGETVEGDSARVTVEVTSRLKGRARRSVMIIPLRIMQGAWKIIRGIYDREHYANPEDNRDLDGVKAGGKLKLQDGECLLLMPVVQHLGWDEALDAVFDRALLSTCADRKGSFLPLDPVLSGEMAADWPNNYEICTHFLQIAREGTWQIRRDAPQARKLGELLHGMMYFDRALKDLLAKAKIPMPKQARYVAVVHADPCPAFLGLERGWRLFGGVWNLRARRLARVFDYTIAAPRTESTRRRSVDALARSLAGMLLDGNPKITFGSAAVEPVKPEQAPGATVAKLFASMKAKDVEGVRSCFCRKERELLNARAVLAGVGVGYKVLNESVRSGVATVHIEVMRKVDEQPSFFLEISLTEEEGDWRIFGLLNRSKRRYYWNPALNHDVGNRLGVGRLTCGDDEGILLLPVVLHIGATDAMNVAFQAKTMACSIASRGRFAPLDPVLPDEIRNRLPNNHSLCCNFLWLARRGKWRFPPRHARSRDFLILNSMEMDLLSQRRTVQDKLGIRMPRNIRFLAFVHVDPCSGPLRLSRGWNLFGGVWDLKTNQLARAFDFTMPVPQGPNFKIAALVDLAGDLEELFVAPRPGNK